MKNYFYLIYNMKSSEIVIITLLLIVLFYINTTENFDMLSDNINTNTEASYKPDDEKPKEYISELTCDKTPTRKCCLVEKKYSPDDNNIYGGNFNYVFKELENENCDLKLFRIDNNKQLFFEGENNWSNEKCNDKVKKIGSCRYVNKECIDFVEKDYCDKYNMQWSERTCNQPLDFKWFDKIKRDLPPQPDDNGGEFKLFD